MAFDSLDRRSPGPLDCTPQEPPPRVSRSRPSSGWLVAVHDPGDSEAIDEKTEASGPERRLQLHFDSPAFRQSSKDAFGFGGIVEA